jgi:uncharacterized protein
MAGTIEGGKKAAAKNLASDPLFYNKIGRKGGQNGTTGGFAAGFSCDGKCNLDHILGYDHKVAQCAGYKGGVKSRRRKVTA